MNEDHGIDSSVGSPFHRGERDIQHRLGVRDRMEAQGRRFIRNFLPEQHRDFYRKLPFILLGTVDAEGRPWASMLFGRPGFADSTDRQTLKLASRPVRGDPLREHLAAGLHVGVLGIEYASRRRNRLTAKVAGLDDTGVSLSIDQTFGNCPRYIQARDVEWLTEIDQSGAARQVSAVASLGQRERELICNADHFYIATHYGKDEGNVAHGADVSHRGGKPGFVRIDDAQTLTFPDFNGNLHYNTLGNISVNPRAGLLFIDFDSGDLLFLTCAAEIIWDSEERRAFTGAESLVRLTIDEGRFVEHAAPLRWHYREQSPMLAETGCWEEVAEKQAARERGNTYRDYRVSHIDAQSSTISSFYLRPIGEEPIPCHVPGQFLPIEIEPESGQRKIRRTYTISSAPNGREYRLSIKREPAPAPELPPGLSSAYFHSRVHVGSTIRAMSPRGKFILDDTSNRAIVLLSAGVGITPMISMLEQLARDCASCREVRPVHFIHGVRNSAEHAFAGLVRGFVQTMRGLTTHIVYSRPLPGDRQGEQFDSSGRIDIGLLKKVLPFDDYDFYLCGPASFMEELYDGLHRLNVPRKRIHYEFFGPGTALKPKQALTSLAGKYNELSPVSVRFARAGIETTWNSAVGSLLDLAEAEGLQPDFSCRSGICQTCATRIVDGEVGYDEPPMVEPEQGMALICCSHPLKNPAAADRPLILDL